jgi:hypothetical protein
MMEAAPKRHQGHEDRQDGDQTHTHTSPLQNAVRITQRTEQPLLKAQFRPKLVANLPHWETKIPAILQCVEPLGDRPPTPERHARKPFVNDIALLMGSRGEPHEPGQ